METSLPPPASTCPKCRGPVGSGEAFCVACGYALQAKPDLRQIKQKIELKQAKQTYQGKIQSGRRTIMTCAVLFTIGTVAVGFLLHAAIDKQQKEIAAAKGNAMYDQDKVLEAERQLGRARGIVTLVTAGYGVLAISFYGLWWWAKTRPLPATLSALILFIAVQALNFAYEEKTPPLAFIIRIAILVALISAVNAAQKFQKMSQQGI